ncbi:hypothetical protein [Frigidibacter sp. ROC022]|uniref:hypothetical protein n=1 Tax=Frigidibacter sp. ROC022 TaxID=2971796 RepID=UPI00215AEB67|nr:hypothetical protein [Frigidibacter sp. ROC022]MCR8723817.1 hypothetical protein [Frigidibacter sp. ROC022]
MTLFFRSALLGVFSVLATGASLAQDMNSGSNTRTGDQCGEYFYAPRLAGKRPAPDTTEVPFRSPDWFKSGEPICYVEARKGAVVAVPTQKMRQGDKHMALVIYRANGVELRYVSGKDDGARSFPLVDCSVRDTGYVCVGDFAGGGRLTAMLIYNKERNTISSGIAVDIPVFYKAKAAQEVMATDPATRKIRVTFPALDLSYDLKEAKRGKGAIWDAPAKGFYGALKSLRETPSELVVSVEGSTTKDDGGVALITRKSTLSQGNVGYLAGMLLKMEYMLYKTTVKDS